MKIGTVVLLAVSLLFSSAASTRAEQVCGGIAGVPCAGTDEFCRLPDGQCCCDAQGICAPIPETCPEIDEPVCGCDGQTYDSRCHADMAAVSVAHACPCGDDPVVVLSAFTGDGLLLWNPLQDVLAYNVYIQQEPGYPSSYQGHCLYAAVPESSTLLRGTPEPDLPWMFQVTALSAEGEGPMGHTSECTPRAPLAPCTCTLPADVGPCDGAIPRWYYDFTAGQCELFFWGGCEGNANNFETQADCEAACMNPCDQPAVHGDCEAAILRWYYNVLSGHCEQFYWGGCNPGANNFETREDCEAVCGDICLLPPDPGDCDGVCPRWYFNPETGQCETFVWGCCGGNANNFPTEEDCEAECLPPPRGAP